MNIKKNKYIPYNLINDKLPFYENSISISLEMDQEAFIRFIQSCTEQSKKFKGLYSFTDQKITSKVQNLNNAILSAAQLQLSILNTSNNLNNYCNTSYIQPMSVNHPNYQYTHLYPNTNNTLMTMQTVPNINTQQYVSETIDISNIDIFNNTNFDNIGDTTLSSLILFNKKEDYDIFANNVILLYKMEE